jgi:ATP-dependent helicase Lhr and Lhr-like helicase
MSNARFLEKRVAEAFYGRFPRLRDVQEAAIEPILAGRNLVLSSGTGSGKTEAVMAPLISRYWQELFQLNSLAIVYVSPTKALANDLHRRLEPPLDYLGLRIGIRHGDRDDLRKKTKPHVVITTPESVDVLLLRQEQALKTVLAVVVDEAHLLYNTQRGIQLSVLMQRLQDVVARPPLQLIAMSATITNLLDTARLIFGRQSNTELLRFPSHRQIDAVIRDGDVLRNDDVTSLVSRITEGRETKILGFVNRRKHAEYFAGQLRSEPHLKGSVFVHYSNLDAPVRLQIENEFAARRTAVCYATSTLELGIDIGDIDAVMLLGVPNGIASFLQRIGRGNRREGKTNAVCFIDPARDCESPPKPPYEPTLIEALRYIALIDSAQKGELPSQHRYELFGAVAQQCLSVIASRKGKYTSLKDLAKLFDHLGYVEEATLKSILDSLVKRSYLKEHGFKTAYGAGEALHKLVAEKRIYGNFPADLQMVKLVHK